GIFVDLGHPGMGAQLEVGIAHRNRNHRDMRAAFGVGLAAEALAEAAILAGAEFRAVGIGVGARRVGCRAREWMVAEALCGRSEHLARQDRRERRQRILVGARRLERIAARLHLAADVSRLAGNRRRAFEPLVIWLELVVGDAPVLDRHVGGNEILPVALLVERAR